MKFHTDSLEGKKFLVTGGAGFIGGHIAEYLLSNGAGLVRVLDNLCNGFQSTVDLLAVYPNFEFIEGDIRDIDTCKKACEGIDHITHQAALGSVPRSIKEPVYFNEVNVGGFVNMLNAAIGAKVKSFVYASSSSVYGDEKTLPKKEEKIGNCLSPYAATKKTNELYAQVFADVYGIKLMGFRYFNIFGPRQDPDGAYAAVIPLFVKGILKETPVYINGDGDQTRDFTFVENAVQINVKGMLSSNEEAFGKVYNVAIGERFTVNELYNTCKEELGSNFEATYREPREGDIRDSLADISLAATLLGYKPTLHFGDGLKKTVAFFKEKYSAE